MLEATLMISNYKNLNFKNHIKAVSFNLLKLTI